MIYLKQLWGFLRSVPAWAYAVAGWAVAYLMSVALKKERDQAVTQRKKEDLEAAKHEVIELVEREAAEKREKLFDEHSDTVEIIDQRQRDIDRAKSLEEIAAIINTWEDR